MISQKPSEVTQTYAVRVIRNADDSHSINPTIVDWRCPSWGNSLKRTVVAMKFIVKFDSKLFRIFISYSEGFGL